MTLDAGGVPIWGVVTGIMVPAVTAAFWLLWGRIGQVQAADDKDRDEIWKALAEQRKDLADYKVAAEQRFAVADTMNKRFDRLEEKIDKLLHLRGMA
ncbi:hypothetical protein [Ferrovibrio sp.]|uniref:hypothetical protein n=1 Tax=Ferrovibrio sp. TaxID=1917215 RepID=UPI003D0C2269